MHISLWIKPSHINALYWFLWQNVNKWLETNTSIISVRTRVLLPPQTYKWNQFHKAQTKDNKLTNKTGTRNSTNACWGKHHKIITAYRKINLLISLQLSYTGTIFGTCMEMFCTKLGSSWIITAPSEIMLDWWQSFPCMIVSDSNLCTVLQKCHPTS